jgi:TonB family protein
VTQRRERRRWGCIRSALALTGSALIALAPVTARAQGQPPPQQQPAKPGPQPPPDRGDVSVPRGEGGAIITPPEKQPETASKAALPRPLNYTPPRYPPEAEKAGLEGAVTLQLDIDKNGKVTKAVVVNPAGHGFDESAIEAAQKLEFSPARRADGAPTAARILYRYSFTLKKADPATGQPEAPAAPADNLTGRVLTAEGDVPLAGATVTLRSAAGEKVLSADDQGAFRFVDLPPGKYTVTVAAPGYDALTTEEVVVAGEATDVKYRLLAKGGGLEVTVRGARPPREVTRRTLERREISRIPGTNGDALRSIQNLPGVARPPAIAGVLLVRGSGPTDTQTFVDGTIVPLIYHFGGLSSTVPTEMIEKIDFYPGNFSAQYGRVMGGIVDVGLRPVNDDGKYHGLVQIDLIDLRALLEGPIPLIKGWTFAAAGRRSWLDTWAGPVLEAAGAGVTQAPVYYDYQFLVQTKPTPRSNFRLGFFGSDDALELLVRDASPQEPALTGNFGLHTAFQRLQARYEHDLDDATRFATVFALGRDNIDAALGPFYFLVEFDSITNRIELSHRLGRGVSVNFGTDILYGAYDVAVRFPPAPRPGEPQNQPFSTRAVQENTFSGSAFYPAAYVEMEISPDARSRIVPGARLDYSNLNGRFDLSPRVNGRYDIVHGYPRTTAKGGVGLFHQPPTFPQVVEPIGNPKLESNRAVHYALGMEQEITRHLEASAEAFFKQLDRLVVGSATASSGNSAYSNIGTGYVIGGEFLLKYKPDERFFGWAAYTLSRSARVDRPDEPEYLVPFDQTHILTVLGSYQLGHGWEFGARFRLVSGNLVTPIVCNPSDGDCDPTRSNALFHAASGAYTPIPLTRPYSERLPMFHQVDIRIDKRWKFKSWQLSAYLDLQNVYNHANSEAIQYNYNYTARQYVSGLPILPSLGLRADF